MYLPRRLKQIYFFTRNVVRTREAIEVPKNEILSTRERKKKKQKHESESKTKEKRKKKRNEKMKSRIFLVACCAASTLTSMF